MEQLIKKLGNSLYGSFGQQNADENYFGKIEDCPIELDEGMLPTPSIIDGVGYISMPSSTKTDSDHTFPCVPGFITSYARVDLLRGFKANENSMVYGDTDSGKNENNPMVGIKIGKELGEWGFEYRDTEEFVKPKVYGTKNKGIPARAELVYEDEWERVFVYKKPNRMRESFKRDLIPNKWEYVVKYIDLVDNKREWAGNESEPIEIGMDIGNRMKWGVR